MSKASRASASGIIFGLFLLVFFICPPPVPAQTSTDPKLEKAIASLRNIIQSEIPKGQEEAKGKEIDNAWDVIRAAGQPGVARLKEEVRRVEAGKESDDYFKLNAGALMWIIGKLAEAETIAQIWRTTPLKAQYNYVFYTAMEAAATQDARALPMLKAVLRDDEGSVYFHKHAMDVRWPRTLEFIWGAYGSKGLPVLHEILETSSYSVELKSTMSLLTSAYYVDALPRMRTLAKNPISGVRYTAIRSLGILGHPQDYEQLISGLRLANPEEVFHHAFALYEYEDLRAVPILIPLLKIENEQLRREIIVSLMHLSTPASFDALEVFCRAPEGDQQKGECAGKIDSTLKEIGLSWERYGKMSASEKEKFFVAHRRKSDDEYKLKQDEKPLTQQQLAEVLMGWKTKGRAFDRERMSFEQEAGADPNKFTATVSKYGWVEERHILSVAIPKDRDVLLDTRASIYRRLSDEALYEVRRINEILKRLIRSQYRSEVGLTEKAQTK